MTEEHDDGEVLVRWESRNGKRWIELFGFKDGSHSYSADDGSGGSWGKMPLQAVMPRMYQAVEYRECDGKSKAKWREIVRPKDRKATP